MLGMEDGTDGCDEGEPVGCKVGMSCSLRLLRFRVTFVDQLKSDHSCSILFMLFSFSSTWDGKDEEADDDMDSSEA